jgi:hypothetical protein
VPFFISCAVLFAFMIISTCLRVLTVVTAFNYVELAYYVIIVLGLAIFFIVTAVKVMKQIRLSQSLSSERKYSGERVRSVLHSLNSIKLGLFTTGVLISCYFKVTRVLLFIASTLIQYFLALAFAPALVFTAQSKITLYNRILINTFVNRCHGALFLAIFFVASGFVSNCCSFLRLAKFLAVIDDVVWYFWKESQPSVR